MQGIFYQFREELIWESKSIEELIDLIQPSCMLVTNLSKDLINENLVKKMS